MDRKRLFISLIVLLAGPSLAVYAAGQGEPAAAGEKAVLTMLDLNPEGGPAIDATIALFQKKNPNIEIQHTTMNSRQYDQRIQALAASGDMPDIATVQTNPQYKQMALNGIFTDLRATALLKGGTLDGLGVSAYTVGDGLVYGTSWNYLAVGAFYNTDIFATYKLDIPKDYPAFLKVCQTLKDNGVLPIISAMGDGWTTVYPLYCAGINLVYAKDGYPAWDKALVTGTKKFNSPDWVESFKRVKQLDEKGYFGENALGGKYEQSLSDFANGKGAMLLIGSWVIPVFLQQNPNLHFSMFPIPFNDPGQTLYTLLESELGMAISKSSKYQKEALSYFDFFYTKEPYEAYLNLKKGFSNVKGINVAFDPSVKYIADNYLVTGKTFPFMFREWPAGTDLLMYKLFQEVLLNQTAIPAALEQMDDYFTKNKK